MYVFVRGRVRARACVRACVRACLHIRMCARALARACVRAGSCADLTPRCSLGVAAHDSRLPAVAVVPDRIRHVLQHRTG